MYSRKRSRNYGGSNRRSNYKATPYKKARYVQKKVQYVPRTRGPNWLLAQAQTGSMTKYYDQASTASVTITGATPAWVNPLNDGAAIDGLFYPARGVAINQREGRRAYVTKIKATFIVEVDSDDATLDNTGGRSVRFALVQDTQCNGSAASQSDPWTSDNVLSFQTLTKMGRFRVLKDKTVWVQNDGLILDTTYKQSAGKKIVKMTWTPKKPVLVHFNETNDQAVTAIVDNNFFFCCSATRGIVNITAGRCRVSFKDV